MSKLVYALLLSVFVNFSGYANAQAVPSPTTNMATVNITGSFQNIIINQSGTGYHTATVTTNGNDIPVTINQSGSTNKTINVNITCATACASSPYYVDQY
jgi:hypothetical protein